MRRQARHVADPVVSPPAAVEGIWTKLSHPLDFDWRFDGETRSALWTKLRSFLEDGEQVVFLGAPSLATAAQEQSYWTGPIILIDQNVPVTSYIGAQHWVRADVLEGNPPDIAASIVVADPPWYEQETLGFLWTAAKMCRLGGHILVCVPPLQTRPGIEEERVRLHDHASSCGLELVRIEAAVLGYETPFFESNALRVSGSNSSTRRRGDLAVYRRTHGQLSVRPVAVDLSMWAEEKIGESRVRVRLNGRSDFENPALRSIVVGDILPSVSRRDPRRADADVWTSGNRIFQCDGSDILRVVLRAVAVGENPEGAVELSLRRPLSAAEGSEVRLTSLQLKGLVDREGREFRAYCESRRIDRRLGPYSNRRTTEQRAG